MHRSNEEFGLNYKDNGQYFRFPDQLCHRIIRDPPWKFISANFPRDWKIFRPHLNLARWKGLRIIRQNRLQIVTYIFLLRISWNRLSTKFSERFSFSIDIWILTIAVRFFEVSKFWSNLHRGSWKLSLLQNKTTLHFSVLSKRGLVNMLASDW